MKVFMFVLKDFSRFFVKKWKVDGCMIMCYEPSRQVSFSLVYVIWI